MGATTKTKFADFMGREVSWRQGAHQHATKYWASIYVVIDRTARFNQRDAANMTLVADYANYGCRFGQQGL